MILEKRIKQAEKALGSDKPPYLIRVIEEGEQPPQRRTDEDGTPIIWFTREDLAVL